MTRNHLVALGGGLLLGAFALGTGRPADPNQRDSGKNSRLFVEAATREYGDPGRRAAEFLVEFMPPADRDNLSEDFLMTNLRLAFEARSRFPWAKDLPEERFRNDVLPYAALDETRDSWRSAMLARGEKIVAGARTASNAAQALNRDLFHLLKVHYHTIRTRPNQSPAESIAQGRATCTGLSILLVDACRAVGIPARVAGVAEWTTKPGNHTWVEIWDGEWKFLGADEYDARGLNRAWFVEDAAKADGLNPRHAIWAASWKPIDGHFPLIWDPSNTSLGAENVTARYQKKNPGQTDGKTRVHLRVVDSSRRRGDSRILVTAELRDRRGRILTSQPTKAGTSDWNNLAAFDATPGEYLWRLSRNGETRESALTVGADREQIAEVDWQKLSPPKSAEPLTKEEARAALAEEWRKRQANQLEERKRELAARSLTVGDKTLRWAERVDGPPPLGGYNLWISLHGGGGTTAEVNDQQFSNHVNLYPPTDGIWVAPRSPTDAWDMWHQSPIDPLLARLIDDFVIAGDVNPDRVYLVGYSAGGDGVYQLAPRMADRLAAAAMMAGHPNDASPLGLRNLPFAIFVGGNDAAYRRNEVAAEWGRKLDDLQKNDPLGYVHWTQIYEGLGHWMNRRDAEALPWMKKFARTPWPKKVVWRQDDVTRDRFYWLAVPPDAARPGQTVIVEVKGQTIEISAEGLSQMELRLSDFLLDLDRPVAVRVNGAEIFRGLVPRTREAIVASLNDRADPGVAATARLDLDWTSSAGSRP